MAVKVDIDNENLNLYFIRQMQSLSEQQKDKLPKELMYRLFKDGGKFNPRNVNKLNILEKMLALERSLGKRTFIIIEDDENGIDVEKFRNNKHGNIQDDSLLNGSFVLGNKELSDTMLSLNKDYISPMYNHCHRLKNMPKSKVKDYKHHVEYIVRMFVNYEARKKKMILQNRMTMPEFLVLMYLYGVEDFAKTSHIYKEVYRYCYQSSSRRIKQAFGSLQVKALVTKIGNTSGSEIKITQLGMDKMNEILTTYFATF